MNTFSNAKFTAEEKKNYQMLYERLQQLYSLSKVFKKRLSKHIYQLNDFIAGLIYMPSEELKTMLENSNNQYDSWVEKARQQDEQNKVQDKDNIE